MAITRITYSNKVDLNENTSIANINKVMASDMNEIKSVVNNNATNIGDMESLVGGTDLVSAVNENKETIDNLSTNLSPTVLYSNTSGTTDTITLSQNVSNFSYIELIYGKGRPEASTKVFATSEYATLIDYSAIAGGPQINAKKVKISGTSITHANGYYLNFTSSGVSTGTVNEISIFRVLGWR